MQLYIFDLIRRGPICHLVKRQSTMKTAIWFTTVGRNNRLGAKWDWFSTCTFLKPHCLHSHNCI